MNEGHHFFETFLNAPRIFQQSGIPRIRISSPGIIKVKIDRYMRASIKSIRFIQWNDNTSKSKQSRTIYCVQRHAELYESEGMQNKVRHQIKSGVRFFLGGGFSGGIIFNCEMQN